MRIDTRPGVQGIDADIEGTTRRGRIASIAGQLRVFFGRVILDMMRSAERRIPAGMRCAGLHANGVMVLTDVDPKEARDAFERLGARPFVDFIEDAADRAFVLSMLAQLGAPQLVLVRTAGGITWKLIVGDPDEEGDPDA